MGVSTEAPIYYFRQINVKVIRRIGVKYCMSRKNSYIFTNKKHTAKGIMATILGLISLATLVYALVMSYRNSGNVPREYGTAALLVTIFAFGGVTLGVISKTEKDRYYLFSYLGIVLNVVALALISAILYAGAYDIGG